MNKLTDICTLSRRAYTHLQSSSGDTRNGCLETIARMLCERSGEILAANNTDTDAAVLKGISKSMLDRLTLTKERIEAIAASIRKVIMLPDPIGNGERTTAPNGMVIEKVHVPIGVIAIIYEARPNVTVDAAALCIKSGNAVILRGGSEAINTNIALTGIIQECLEKSKLFAESVQIIEDTSREKASELMRMKGHIDLLIPRGGKSLIDAVVRDATVPVIETGAGNCHIYIERTADFGKAVDIVANAKLQRPSVCNSAESLVVDSDIAAEVLPLIQKALGDTELRGCERAVKILPNIKKASDEDFYTEYNDYIMSVKIVDGTEEAIRFINEHSTSHSECIVTQSLVQAELFKANIDSAAVYVNVSTRFTDGEVFGLGAEIGISTQKFHARGPLGLAELTTYKYLITGNGQIRA